MKKLLLALAILAPAVAHGQGTFKGYDELRKVQAAEAAETERQEKWMMVVGAIAAVGIGYWIWRDQAGRKRKN